MHLYECQNIAKILFIIRAIVYWLSYWMYKLYSPSMDWYYSKIFFLLLFLMLQIQITVNKTETLRSTSYYFQAWKYYLWDLQYFRAPKELNSTWFMQEGVKAASENYFTLWFDLCLFWMWCKPWLIIGRCAKECPVWHNSRKINEMFACSFWFWEERAERL